MLQQQENDKVGLIAPVLRRGEKPKSLREVMEEEMAANKTVEEWKKSNRGALQKKQKNESLTDTSQFNLASKMNFKKLSEMFPSIDQSLLMEMFRVHKYEHYLFCKLYHYSRRDDFN